MEMESRVFSPERYLFSSKDNQTADASLYYNSFKINLASPILNVKSLELLRATVPCIFPTIPDSETTFWYYRLPKQVGFDEPVPPSPEYLHCVRLQPSFVPKELVYEGDYPINRIYSGYEDLLGDLKKACVADVNNPYFIEGDIDFEYDEVLKKFVFVGKNVYGDVMGDDGLIIQYFYSYAGFKDPSVEAAKVVLYNASKDNFGIVGLDGQPFWAGRDLNQRLGFVWSGDLLSQNDYRNHIRPVPHYIRGNAVLFDVPKYTAESYADLVHSANLHIYCNFVSGSGYDTQGNPNLLDTISLETGVLGVASYQNSVDTHMYKVNNDIYEVQFFLRTDSGAPFSLPKSAITVFEIKFSYK